MGESLQNIYANLFAYCKERDFSGHDPFDGLNSRLFQASPLKFSAAARLAWLQMIKRSPVDLRRPLLVAEGVNPKTLALFSLAELSRLRSTGDEAHAANARHLLERLSNAAIICESGGAAFGYDFDWQSRMFYAPRGTPAIVPTAFAFQAFFQAYQHFGDERFLGLTQDICRFIVNDLNRTVETDDEVCFSYTPLDGTAVYNASLLAGECLARVGSAAGTPEYLALAAKAARFVLHRQRDDGAWVYGVAQSQGWVDNFHTAYILVSLHRISAAVPEISQEIAPALRSGIDYWLANLFLNDGTPKYYDKEVFPIDIHSAAAAAAALTELAGYDGRAMPLAKSVISWTCANMLDRDGSFYYQKRRSRIIKTRFMRWGQAWMAFAMARLIEARGTNG